MLQDGKKLRSPGGSFAYEIQGPVCVLYDREQLPWPSCSLQWKGLQPSWNRQGKRFVPDMASRRCEAYSVKATDMWGHEWEQVLTMFHRRLTRQEKNWWYWKGPLSKSPPNYVKV